MKRFSAFGVECTPTEIISVYENLVKNTQDQIKEEEISGKFRFRIKYGKMGSISSSCNPLSKYCFTRIVITENGNRAIYWRIWNNTTNYYRKQVYPLFRG